MKTDIISKQFSKVLKELDKALLLIDVEVKEKWFKNAKLITQIKYKTDILGEQIYEYRRKLRLKEQAIITGYKDYPYKVITDKGKGYTRLYTKDFEKFVYEHRYLIQNKIGRKLSREELIHHIDRNKSNNNLNNLKIVSAKEHYKIHFSKEH